MNINSTIKLHTGREIPIMGLGTWQLTNDTADMVAEALELGYPMIDTSGDYGTQPGIGKGIKQSGRDRDSFYLVTKVEETDDAYKATKDDLEELQLDYANLMLIHRPPKNGVGEDLWRGLIRARDEKLTPDIGVSNYSVEKLQALIDISGETPVVNQIEWSPFGWSQSMLDFCRSRNIIIMAYSPLTRGKRLQDETLETIAAKYSRSPAQIIIRWNLQKGVVPIVKANKLDHLQKNLGVFDFKLTEQDMARLDNLNEGFSSLGPKLAYM